MSHVSYKDILDIHLKQFDKFIKDIEPIICFNDKEYIDTKYENKYKVIEYDDKLPYMERMLRILENIESEYVIWTHEHNILVAQPQQNVINKTVKFMEENNADQVRLFVSGINNPIFQDGFHKIGYGSHYFSVNTAMWRKTSLQSVASNHKNHIYRCSECAEIQNYVKNMNNYYLSSSNDIKLQGHGHVISYDFPLCHAITNGKWAVNPVSEQTNFIYMLLSEYEINIDVRGRT